MLETKHPLPRSHQKAPSALRPPEKIAGARDRRVSQFVRGEAGERLSEMRLHNGSEQWMNV